MPQRLARPKRRARYRLSDQAAGNDRLKLGDIHAPGAVSMPFTPTMPGTWTKVLLCEAFLFGHRVPLMFDC